VARSPIVSPGHLWSGHAPQYVLAGQGRTNLHEETEFTRRVTEKRENDLSYRSSIGQLGQLRRRPDLTHMKLGAHAGTVWATAPVSATQYLLKY